MDSCSPALPSVADGAITFAEVHRFALLVEHLHDMVRKTKLGHEAHLNIVALQAVRFNDAEILNDLVANSLGHPGRCRPRRGSSRRYRSRHNRMPPTISGTRGGSGTQPSSTGLHPSFTFPQMLAL